jgi:hypothetical protein
MGDPREDSQGDRARLNARVERLEDWQDSVRDLLSELREDQVRLRIEFDAAQRETATRVAETAKVREKGGDRMFATVLVVLSAVLSAAGAIVHLVRR